MEALGLPLPLCEDELVRIGSTGKGDLHVDEYSSIMVCVPALCVTIIKRAPILLLPYYN